MTSSTPPERGAPPAGPATLVVLGAMGDLALRHLVPALAALQHEGGLPSGLRVLGFGLEPVGTEDYRSAAWRSLAQHAPDQDRAERAALVQRLEYRCTDLRGAPGASGPLPAGSLIAYLALPAGVQASAVRWLAAAGVVPGSRIVVEKPFGEDLASARELTRLLHTVVEEADVFRADHFLHHRSVRDLLAMRSAGPVLEPRWHRGHVRSVEIVWEETADVSGRAAFYDRTGALRDMVQSHLLQLLAVVAMEQPTTGEADLREAKLAVLRRIASLDPPEVAVRTVRGRYTTGAAGRVPRAYVEEPGVDPSRDTETYASVQLEVDSPRWHGVPFVLRTGKALGRPGRHVDIRFRPQPGLPASGSEQVLRLELAPDPDGLPATARILRDVLAGRTTSAVGHDEVEECWRVVDSIRDTWRTGVPPLQEYAAGSRGPLDG